MSCCEAKRPALNNYESCSNFFYNLKSSVLCGANGFLTFNLAFLSYLELSLLLKQVNDISSGQKFDHILEQRKEYILAIKKSAVFTMKRNIIPFIEMVTILPFVHYALPVIIKSTNFIQYKYIICVALMITTCFIVTNLKLREKLIKYFYPDLNEATIGKEFEQESIVYPIFLEGKRRLHSPSYSRGSLIQYNSPYSNTKSQLGGIGKISYRAQVLNFPLKLAQSAILFALFTFRLLAIILSFFTDIFFDRSFNSTDSNLQESCHLLYAVPRNLFPMSEFDRPVADFIKKGLRI